MNRRARQRREVAAKTADSADCAAAFEGELRDTHDRLQSTIEEYETTLDELKSANEELVSLNEEMQSSNEELESSKEELQSLNEELQTVNHELSDKVEELDRANSDLRNVFVSTQIATVFLDQNLVIRSFHAIGLRTFQHYPDRCGASAHRPRDEAGLPGTPGGHPQGFGHGNADGTARGHKRG